MNAFDNVLQLLAAFALAAGWVVSLYWMIQSFAP
jgi:hypothetical protein